MGSSLTGWVLSTVLFANCIVGACGLGSLGNNPCYADTCKRLCAHCASLPHHALRQFDCACHLDRTCHDPGVFSPHMLWIRLSSGFMLFCALACVAGVLRFKGRRCVLLPVWFFCQAVLGGARLKALLSWLSFGRVAGHLPLVMMVVRAFTRHAPWSFEEACCSHLCCGAVCSQTPAQAHSSSTGGFPLVTPRKYEGSFSWPANAARVHSILGLLRGLVWPDPVDRGFVLCCSATRAWTMRHFQQYDCHTSAANI